MALALFDLDNTLLEGDSDYQWGVFLVEKNLVDQQEYEQANQYFYDQYKEGCLDIVEFSSFCFKPLAARSFDELATLHQQFMQEHIIPVIRAKAQSTIDKHRQQGDTLMIITATNTFIATPIAKYFGIEHVLATQPKIVNGRYTTDIDGTPCFQEGKVTRLNEWMKAHQQTLAGSYFYSDSINDLPLLEAVDTPIVVDPDDSLKQVASERGWQIISLR